MADPVREAREQGGRLIRDACGCAAARGLIPAGTGSRAGVEASRDGRNGDFTASFALAEAGAAGMAPLSLAQTVLGCLELGGSPFECAEAAGPGYLNLSCGPRWYGGVLSAVEDAHLGAAPLPKPLPTPPASLEEVRRRAWGDALANLRERTGEETPPVPSDIGPVALLREGRPAAGGWTEAGEDALRYSLTVRPARCPVELDLDLAARQDGGDPLYRIQYSCARIRALTEGAAEGPEPDPALLSAGEELALIKALARYPGQVRRAAQDGDPSQVNRYVTALAGEFRRWYGACPIRGAGGALGAARRKLARCTGAVLADGLGLLGVSARRR